MVSRPRVLHDENGTAAVVELRSKTGQAQADLPIAIVVTAPAASGCSQRPAGLAETRSTHVPLRGGRRAVSWVTTRSRRRGDEGRGEGRASKVEAAREAAAAGRRARSRSSSDPAVPHQRQLRNDSRRAESSWSCSRWRAKGGRVVAAGRAASTGCRPRREALQGFLIGDPAGARGHRHAAECSKGAT